MDLATLQLGNEIYDFSLPLFVLIGTMCAVFGSILLLIDQRYPKRRFALLPNGIFFILGGLAITLAPLQADRIVQLLDYFNP